MSHRDFYSSLCGEYYSCEPIKKFREEYHLLFEKYGVDLNLVDMLIIIKEHILYFITI